MSYVVLYAMFIDIDDCVDRKWLLFLRKICSPSKFWKILIKLRAGNIARVKIYKNTLYSSPLSVQYVYDRFCN